jgi:extracellular factor (EF) 3-hydroxypalmitic acid methyl ester biosynthesis protein
VALLCDELRLAMQASPREEWAREAAPACRRHPLHGLLLQDPYTRRAFEKPRGYAGDAVMFDYAYGGVAPDGTTDLGREVFRVTASGLNARSVVARRDLLAGLIDETADRVEAPAMLSLGCGNLREAQRTCRVRPGRAGTLYALDQDDDSLVVVEREQGGHGVRTIRRPAVSLFRGGERVSGLNLAYASGLFDYLPDALAARLLRALFEMLAPGGRLLIANFTPDNHGRAYMEAVVDWWLVYRDDGQMEQLADAVTGAAVYRRSVFHDDDGNIVYLELTRTT